MAVIFFLFQIIHSFPFQSKRDLEREIDEINASRPQCPVGLNTLVISRKVTPNENQQQPYVYLNCGHVQGLHDWGQDKDSGTRKCPICLEVDKFIYEIQGRRKFLTLLYLILAWTRGESMYGIRAIVLRRFWSAIVRVQSMRPYGIRKNC